MQCVFCPVLAVTVGGRVGADDRLRLDCFTDLSDFGNFAAASDRRGRGHGGGAETEKERYGTECTYRPWERTHRETFDSVLHPGNHSDDGFVALQHD